MDVNDWIGFGVFVSMFIVVIWFMKKAWDAGEELGPETFFKCSLCDIFIGTRVVRYCPNCGAQFYKRG